MNNQQVIRYKTILSSATRFKDLSLNLKFFPDLKNIRVLFEGFLFFEFFKIFNK